MTPPTGRLPALRSLLAVTAHPDDESFGLGAVLDAFARAGAATFGLCLTHGEASTLHLDGRDLATVRTAELEAAAQVLGMASVRLLDHPDGGLDGVPLDLLEAAVAERALATGAQALLVFDDGGITGHPDHQRATDAALAAAVRLGLPVLAWAVPAPVARALNEQTGGAFAGREDAEIDVRLAVDRRRQVEAIRCHASQSTSNPVLWRRLALTGDSESLRWLRPPAQAETAAGHAGGHALEVP